VLWQPALNSLDWRVIVLALLSAILLFRFHWGISRVLVLASVSGVALATMIT
jgi:chromate transporter